MSGLYQQPYHFYPATVAGKTQVKLSSGCSSCNDPVDVSTIVTQQSCFKQSGGGSDFEGLFHANIVNARELSLITARYIDQSPMFNPLRKNTVIPTIYDGIVPTGAYLLNTLPSTPTNTKYANDVAASDIHCLCQKNNIKMYDEIDGKLVPRSQASLVQKLQQRGC